MRATFGEGGWVGVDDVGLQGPLYVRIRPAQDGRLRIREFYLDASQADDDLTQGDLRAIPLSAIEALINAHAESAMSKFNSPGPDLSTLASYFCKYFNPVTWDRETAASSTWVAQSFLAQRPEWLADSDAPAIPTAPRENWHDWHVHADSREFVLKSGPEAGLTDEFLRDVGKAYTAAASRGEKPNAAIADQTGYPVKTVQRWVYTARQRRIMPRGRRGKVG